LFHHVALFFHKVKVFALIGKSGTGKSFRAQLIARRFGIDIIIDDGLVIRDQRILAGKSAKKENRPFTAVKTALFFDRDHAREVIDILKAENFKKVLIVATSDRMAGKIARRLQLPEPGRWIRIEDIATREEIEAAGRSRAVSGKHIIPVPAVEVKREHSHIFLDSIQIFLKRKLFFRRAKSAYEKTLVRPTYSNKGLVRISESAVSQMVFHCVNEYNPEIKITKIVVASEHNAYKLEVVVRIPFGMKVSGWLHGLQLYILENIEHFTGLDLKEVNVTVGAIARPQAGERRLFRRPKRDKRNEEENQDLP
jgi:uncharacterized alkaline shock family protein YloU